MQIIHHFCSPFQIVDSLYEGVRTALKEAGVKDTNIYDTTVPGAFELPLATRFLALSRQCDVVIALGCLIKGDTMHFEYIADAVANGLMSVSLCCWYCSVVVRGKGNHNTYILYHCV